MELMKPSRQRRLAPPGRGAAACGRDPGTAPTGRPPPAGSSQGAQARGPLLFVPSRTCRPSGALPPSNNPPNLGDVKVGAFSGSTAEAAAFANAIQNTIRVADRDDLIGWIVDLRGNGGGNMWPMIAGL